MNYNDLFPGRYLKSEELNGPILVTVASVEKETFDDGDEGSVAKPILITNEAKPMVLNQTNARTLFKILGKDTTQWAGQQCVIYRDDNIQFGGKTVSGLRVRAPKLKAAPPPAPAPAPPVAAPVAAPVPDNSTDSEDDVPF